MLMTHRVGERGSNFHERARLYGGQKEAGMRKQLIRLTVLLALAITAGCGDSHPSAQSGAGGAVATFSRVQTEIFTPTCAVIGCHDTVSHQSGLDLSLGQSYVQIVNIASTQVPSLKRIAPNDPVNSYLLQKINGTATTGNLMPPGTTPVPDAQINLVRDWILRGAPND